jgi:hypothetical protein
MAISGVLWPDSLRWEGTQYDWCLELDWNRLVSLGTSGADVAAARALSVSQMPASLYRPLGRNDANGALYRRRPGRTSRLSMTGAAKTSVLRAASADPTRSLLTANLTRGSHSVESIWQHRCRLLCVARRILRNEADAEDAVQEAYLSAVRHFGKFEGRSSILTWLTAIVVNQALTQLRVGESSPHLKQYRPATLRRRSSAYRRLKIRNNKPCGRK